LKKQSNVDAVEVHYFSLAYQEFEASFGIYDRDENQWREELLNALLPE